MTCFWPIFFSAVLAAPAATLSGTVELRESRDPAVRKRQDYSGVVVWLTPGAGAPAAPVAARRAKMDQKDKTFLPHVLPVLAGTLVEFPNSDPIFHNAFSNYNGQIFDVGLYPPGSSKSFRFTRPGVVRIFCNIHASMSAVIVVLETPYFVVTGSNGRFDIPNVPPGEYTLRVYHERATQATLDALTSSVTVADRPQVLPAIAISESGYLAVPHRNKYDRDYPAEGGSYPKK